MVINLRSRSMLLMYFHLGCLRPVESWWLTIEWRPRRSSQLVRNEILEASCAFYVPFLHWSDEYQDY